MRNTRQTDGTGVFVGIVVGLILVVLAWLVLDLNSARPTLHPIIISGLH